MRVRVVVQGIVQGVGFRPFVYGLANRLELRGFVRNDPSGVTIEVQGDPAVIDTFLADLVATAPPLARIESVTPRFVPPVAGEAAFAIVASSDATGAQGASGAGWLALVSPDVATCEDCLAEIRDPAARRYGYAFTNCTNCGPRFTITTDIPYDRPNTTMAGFPMCDACRAEYEDPADRRFHAQPIACPVCGPAVSLAGVAPADALAACAGLLRGGSIVALKGLGGYHLVCDARNEKAVGELRARKVREDKPFALMARGVGVVRQICEVSDHEAALLGGYRRPVVLLRRRPDVPDGPVGPVGPDGPDAGGRVAASVAPGNRFLGFMLPYTPLHHLLLDAFGPGGVLVMTSGNHSDEPIAYLDGDARERLDPIADVFVSHNRPIHVRCDDSVTRSFRGEEYLLRRSRGYAPEPLLVAEAFRTPVLATGAELKHTFCLGSGTRAFLSHHIGDLENWETMRSFIEGVAHFCNVFQIRPGVIAHDLHPEYLATKWAIDQAEGDAAPPRGVELEGCRLIGVQHHHAHIAACLADNQLPGPVIGLALDGTGWGTDGTIWGGEVLVADLAGFRRVGHLRPVALPGGAAAIREPWRSGANYLREAFGAGAAGLPLPFVRDNAGRWGTVLDMAVKGINAPLTSSAGRLFDAAAAITGLRGTVNYEGQAAIELEQAADPSSLSAYPCPVDSGSGVHIIDGVGLIRALAEDLASGTARPLAAARFHNGLAGALVETCIRVRDEVGLGDVALSGGTFQNLLLLERIIAGLESAGFGVHRHRRVPANDGGISLGQAMVAGAAERPA